MATMMKEKRRSKKKTKKVKTNNEVLFESESIICGNVIKELSEPAQSSATTSVVVETTQETESFVKIEESIITDQVESENINETLNTKLLAEEQELCVDNVEPKLLTETLFDQYSSLNRRLENLTIPYIKSNVNTQLQDQNLLEESENKMSETWENLENEMTSESSININACDTASQIAPELSQQETPSAPIFDEEHFVPEVSPDVQQPLWQESSPMLEAVSLEEAMNLFCEREIAEITAMSEREKISVEQGPVCGAEHPLVDLLSTFKRSLMAVERVKHEITCAINDEQAFRSKLWRVSTKDDKFVEKCKCGADVFLRIKYEVAELMRHNLPAARMKLQLILKDVQESYCHQQLAALLSHCQIEELLIEIMHGSVYDIREALSLILQALQFSDTAPPVLAKALIRWATALSAALDTGRDPRQLLFLIHHLFRQTHSVRWAASVIRMSCNDSIKTARAILILDILLNRPQFEVATECTEEDEAWEEVDKRGSTGGVEEGSLRERDILALLAAFPLREISARLLACTRADVTTISENDLTDPYGGQHILKCCYGVRTFLSVIHKAISMRSSYRQLRNELTHIAAKLGEGLAQLHLSNSSSYKPGIFEKVTAELESIFATLQEIFTPDKLEMLPVSLLRENSAAAYCSGLIDQMHNESSCCVTIVRIVTSASCSRSHDHKLASTVAEFLIKTGLCNRPPCKLGCESVSRDCITQLLQTHPYLQTIALHLLADFAQTCPISPPHISCLSLARWRPCPAEVDGVLQNWRKCCPDMLETILMELEYTPHVGVSLPSQLSIGSFLCDLLAPATPPGPDWPWRVLRKLRPHRSFWNLPLDVPPPEKEDGLFACAWAVLSGSWGHCIPLICTSGVSTLVKLAASRPEDAVHCLGAVMLVMQHSPESVALTKQFGEVLDTLLVTGPTLVQRALGRGPPAGAQLVRELVLEQLANTRYGNKSSLLCAWLHALWRPGPGLMIADEVVRSSRLWTVADDVARGLVQDPSTSALISATHRSACPLLSESLLRASHALLSSSGLWTTLCTAIYKQKTDGLKIHVDRALQQIGSQLKSDDLSIYTCATVALSAPAPHPAHLTLFAAMMYLYLQRPTNMGDSTPPVGPLFFSGYTKSRTFAQLQKRLQELITYHQSQAEILNKMLKNQPKITPVATEREKNIVKKNEILPSVSICNLIGESEESDSESEESEGDVTISTDTSERDREISDGKEMVKYHNAAEKMLIEYARWLEEGEKTRAMPFHADIARFIPETCLNTAWRTSVPQTNKQEHIPAIPLPAHRTHAQILREAVAGIKDVRRRSRGLSLRSVTEDVNFADARTMLDFFEKHLVHIAELASEWTKESDYISSLDNQLLQLVTSLRVPRTLPPRSNRCQNNCKPVTMVFSVQEWCVSEAAEQGIVENRSRALSAIKKLSRPRAHTACTIAALHTLARHIRSKELAKRVLEAAYKSAKYIQNCELPKNAISDLVEELAERWITQDGPLCAEMLNRWSNTPSSVQQQLCNYLVNPRKLLNDDHWLLVYMTIVKTRLPSHVKFSLMSKFDVPRWCESAHTSQRRELCSAALQLAQSWGARPAEEHLVLVELCGVHSCAAVRGPQLAALVADCSLAAARRSLPAAVLTHVGGRAGGVAHEMTAEQLRFVLHELGAIWWEARTNKRESNNYDEYATHIAVLLTVLLRAFVMAAVNMSYTPERVGQHLWLAVEESWSPWVSPHGAGSLLATSDASELAVRMLRELLLQLMLDCPGIDIYILREAFSWIIHLKLDSQDSNPVLMTSLMMEMTSLPWTQLQWIDEKSIQSAFLAATSPDCPLGAWSAARYQHTAAGCWMQGTEDLASRLQAVLALFTERTAVGDETIRELSLLPWFRLPEPVIDGAQQQFFTKHYNLLLPYHKTSQFTVLLLASGLLPPARAPAPRAAPPRPPRALLISHWTRVLCDPAFIAHVEEEEKYLLDVITNLAPHLEPGSMELEELLSRAIVIMCVEPAAAKAAKVWLSWLSSASSSLLLASISATCSLTTIQYYAMVAEAACKRYMSLPDSSWSTILPRAAPSPWASSVCSLLSLGALHCTYLSLRTINVSYEDLRAVFVALREGDWNFKDNELIISVLILFSVRISLPCIHSDNSAMQDCLSAARALTARGGEGRSLLRSIGLQGGKGATDNHRLLCRLAQCVLDPNCESYIRAYESLCLSVLGSHPHVVTWGRNPHPTKLARLAMTLFPNCDRYFKDELELANV